MNSTAVHFTTLLGTAIILLCVAIMNGYLDRLLKRICPKKAETSTNDD